MNTENIAHEKRYRDWWAQDHAMFAPENRFPQQDEQFPLTDGYSICSKAYIYNGDPYLSAVKVNCWTMMERYGMLGVIWIQMMNSASCFATTTESTI